MTEPARSEMAISSYLLGELDQAERAEFERRLAADHALREEVEALRPVVARLETLPPQAWDPPEPPRLRAPATEAATAAAGPAAAGRRAERRGWLGPAPLALAGGLAALLLAAGIWIGTLIDDEARDGAAGAPAITLSPIDGGDGHGELTILEEGGRATLAVSGLPPSRGDFYEVWLLGERGMVSLASFRVGAEGRATVELNLPVDPSRYGSFDVSREPDDGDPAHSSDSVLQGPAGAA
jgi:anti-sigma-K factor RskA